MSRLWVLLIAIIAFLRQLPEQCTLKYGFWLLAFGCGFYCKVLRHYCAEKEVELSGLRSKAGNNRFVEGVQPARSAEGEAPILLETDISARRASTAVSATIVFTLALNASSTFSSIFSKIPEHGIHLRICRFRNPTGLRYVLEDKEAMIRCSVADPHSCRHKSATK